MAFKLYREMTDEEKQKHKERTEVYRKKNMHISRECALHYYHNNKEKCADKAKKWRDKNKEYIKQKQKEDKRKRKEEAVAYLGGICIDCGDIFHPSVFDFHHRNPEGKSDRDPSKMLTLKWTRIVLELDKCDLLCANCHRLRHHGEKYENAKI